METVIEVSAQDKVIMAGTGRESTEQSITDTKEAASMGIHFESLIPPSFFAKKMTDQVLSRHFRLIADISRVPVLLYNNPEVAVVTLSPGLIGEVSKNPNIVGMKDSSKGNFASYVLAAGPDFNILAGSANFFFTGLLMGAVGGVLSLADAFPEPCCKLYDLGVKGHLEEGRKLQYQLSV